MSIKRHWTPFELATVAMGAITAASLIYMSLGTYGSAEIKLSERTNTVTGEVQQGYVAVGYRHNLWVIFLLIGLGQLGLAALLTAQPDFDRIEEADEEIDGNLDEAWAMNQEELEEARAPRKSSRKQRNVEEDDYAAQPVNLRPRLRLVEGKPEYETVLQGGDTQLQQNTKFQVHSVQGGAPGFQLNNSAQQVKSDFDAVPSINAAEMAAPIRQQSDLERLESWEGINMLARNDKSVALIGVPKTGKTTAIYAFIMSLFEYDPDSLVKVSSLKNDKFLGLAGIPGCVSVIPMQNMEHQWHVLLRDLEITIQVLQHRSQIDEGPERDALKTYLHVLDDYYGMVTLLGGTTTKPNPILVEIRKRINWIIVMGREFKVRLCFGTHSLNLNALGIDGSDIRNGVGMLINGYQSPSKEGDYQIPARVLTPKWTGSTAETAELQSEFETAKALSIQHGRPLYVSTIAGRVSIKLYPDLGDIKTKTLPEEQRLRIFKNLIDMSDYAHVFWNCEDRAAQLATKLGAAALNQTRKIQSAVEDVRAVPATADPGIHQLSAQESKRADDLNSREQLLQEVGIRAPQFQKLLILKPVRAAMTREGLKPFIQELKHLASICKECGISEVQSVAVIFELRPSDQDFSRALNIYRFLEKAAA